MIIPVQSNHRCNDTQLCKGGAIKSADTIVFADSRLFVVKNHKYGGQIKK